MRNIILRSANTKYHFIYFFLFLSNKKRRLALNVFSVFFGVNHGIDLNIFFFGGGGLLLCDPCHSLYNTL